MSTIEQRNKSKRIKEQFGENKFMLKKKHKAWSQSQDDKWGKSHNVKEHSAEDNAVDKLHGIKDKKHKASYRKPKAQGKGIVKALGQKGTTGNFAKIAASKGKGAAIAALQNKLAARRGQPIPFHRKRKHNK